MHVNFWHRRYPGALGVTGIFKRFLEVLFAHSRISTGGKYREMTICMQTDSIQWGFTCTSIGQEAIMEPDKAIQRGHA